MKAPAFLLFLVLTWAPFPLAAWEFTGLNWSATGDHQEAGAPTREFSWAEGPRGKAVTVSARVTITGTKGDDWKNAGVVVGDGSLTFWHLALVEAPGNPGRRFVELSEMREGTWNAQSADRLAVAEEKGMGLAWEPGRTYVLTLKLGAGRIAGTVTQPDGAVLARMVRVLAGAFVGAGRPGLDDAGFEVRFDGVSTSVAEPLPDLPPPAYPPYGTSPDGTFSVDWDAAGRWWLKTPDGQSTWARAIDHVNFNDHWCEALGYAPYHRNVQALFASESAWGDSALRRLASWNFNILGAGASSSLLHRGLAHTELLSLGQDFARTAALVPPGNWTGVPDVFDPRWQLWCDLRARDFCAAEKHDPWLVGYFLDNELDWWGRAPQGSLRNWALTRPEGDPARVAAEATDDPGFETLVAEKYFSTAVAAIRRYDPRHLILGNRIAGRAPDGVWAAAGRWSDVVSVNLYQRLDPQTGDTALVRQSLETVEALAGRPLWITEWSYPALDAVDSQGIPLPSVHGAGMRVDDQAQRARASALFQAQAARLPFVVGTSYFMWADEPSRGISATFPEDSNYGLVDEADHPYPALTAAFADVNARTADLHRNPGSPEPPLPATRLTGAAPFWSTTGAGVEAGEGNLVLKHHSGSGDVWDEVEWKEVPLGSYRPMVHLNQGKDQWLPPDSVAFDPPQSQGDRLVVTAEVGRKGLWKGSVELQLVPGLEGFLVRWASLTNSGPGAWNLVRLYQSLPPLPGAQPAGPRVPNYWLQADRWETAGSAGTWGAVAGPQAPWSIFFWRDSQDNAHPDISLPVGKSLGPGETWTGPTPWVAILAGPAGTGWTATARTVRGALLGSKP